MCEKQRAEGDECVLVCEIENKKWGEIDNRTKSKNEILESGSKIGHSQGCKSDSGIFIRGY